MVWGGGRTSGKGAFSGHSAPLLAELGSEKRVVKLRLVPVGLRFSPAGPGVASSHWLDCSARYVASGLQCPIPGR